ncbi:glycine--tRNA ligase subunit beta [Rickettsiales endosymbiont of Peranema trichophorum]|uniref:glycine--tRNA ligase subunit beta n=1 Tax=Rickettsiales endosymbiont of Peranema trichophorum TaxID=2486577 RepID=UPI001023B90B|nr:glycine--tRNA ligase subunit beta [Rickettsiales endosymbiont of Peranema trichophorum]RZI46331.1 glycine--tRNA ligase subunit beta [Rickettsiales endosymbiont of Peranema trichophorum]
MNELLLELFSEEMPAIMIESGARQLASSIAKNISEKLQNVITPPEVYFTPVRIVVYFRDIPESNTSESEEIRGPRIEAAPTAITGFMKKYNITRHLDLEVRDGFYFYHLPREQKNLKALLQESIEEALNELTWPKSMRWGDYDIKWIRPLRSILCLLNKDVIEVRFGHLTAGNTTRGHRFLSEGLQTVQSANVDDYAALLKQHNVILSQEERRDIILKQSQTIGEIFTPVEDQQLLSEIVNLVEYPVLYLGEINSRFMVLPEELLITTLRNHQRYIMLRDRSGRLAPYFVIVSNIPGVNGGKEIIEGNQSVLEARLYDALFLFTNDREMKLEERVLDLRKVLFHSELGSVYDKIASIKTIASKLLQFLSEGTDCYDIPIDKLDRTIELMKADLTTETVREFPELQGIIGYYCALYNGEEEDIAIAIREHYKPNGAGDTTPSRPLSVLAAMADKLDTLNKMFSIGIKPTGSKDPFALRRAANGVIRIIKANGLNIDIELDFHLFGIREDVVNFILERMINEAL